MTKLMAFHFIQPMWLWLLLAVPVGAWLLSRRGGTPRVFEGLVDSPLLPFLMEGKPARQRLTVGVGVLAAVLAIVAMAGPSWDRQPQPLFSDRAAQLVAVSMSSHMQSRDLAPDRASRARYKVRDLFQANRDGLNGLVAYAGDAFLVAPLTSDAHSTDELLNALSPDAMPVDGNDAARAIDMGADAIVHAASRGGSLVVVTDDADKDAVAAAARARARGIRVSVLGIGTVHGGPVAAPDGGFIKDASGNVVMAPRNDAALSALARAGGGIFVPMDENHRDIDALRGMLVADPSQAKAGEAEASEWQDRGPWFVLALLPLFALMFRRGWLLLAVLVLAPMVAPSAQADDIFHNRNQRAAAALAAGDASKARALATDPALAAAAAYKENDYGAAADAYAKLPGSDAAYNLGNALAKAGKYPEAIAAYDRALKLQPEHADAAANRKAVEAFMKQQDKQQKQPSKDTQQGKDGDDKQKGEDGKGKDKQGGKQDSGGQQQNPGRGQGEDSPSQGEGTGESNGKAPPAHPNPDDAGKGGKDATGKLDKENEARQDAQAKAAQQALKEQMDRAMAAQGKTTKGDGTHDLGVQAEQDDGSNKLPAAMRQALQRVPDDPGGLLRRKFMLDYQRRQGVQPDDEP
jgi:Ca-activated chloride channel homolog